MFEFSISGPAGSSVVVEGSTNLADWSPLKTVDLEDGTGLFEDQESPDDPLRFYRVRVP